MRATDIYISCAFPASRRQIGALLLDKFTHYGVAGLAGRDSIWSTAISTWKKNPVLGAGTNYFSQNNSKSSHSVYLQLLCENGALGLFSFIVFEIAGFFSSAKAIFISKVNDEECAEYVACTFFQIFYLVHGITESVLANSNMYIVHLLFMVYSLSLTRSVRRGCLRSAHIRRDIEVN